MKQLFWLLLVSLVLSGCDEPSVSKDELGDTRTAHEKLVAHSATFERGIVRVADNIHVAIGYGLANTILIEGEDGVVIVDTLESIAAAKAVKAEFDKITSKPVKAIIYTHNHADHVFGAGVFAGDDRPEIISFATTPDLVNRIVNVIRPIIEVRSVRQFGTQLPRDQVPNAGIGPFLAIGTDEPLAYRRPTTTFRKSPHAIEIAGIRMELHFAPGETPDQIFVYLPDQRILLPGDNYYHAFPNLYAIRGTAYRDVTQWVDSLDRMRSLNAEALVPSHSRPVIGAEKVRTVLTNYRDAIQFVHDQTVRLMNQGLTPDEIVAQLKLPPHLARLPYLQPFYGRVEWAVRSIFSGYLGWFSGDAVDLKPLAPEARAKRMAELAGGAEALRSKARAAARAGDHQWALRLAGHLLRLDPDDRVAGELRVTALTALGEAEISATGRNYYLTQALEAGGRVIPKSDPEVVAEDFLRQFPIGNFMAAMAVNLDPEAAADETITVGFRFTDVAEDYAIHVRRGIAELQAGYPKTMDAGITMDSFVWKEILTKRRNFVAALVSGDLELTGEKLTLLKFLSLFQADG